MSLSTTSKLSAMVTHGSTTRCSGKIKEHKKQPNSVWRSDTVPPHVPRRSCMWTSRWPLMPVPRWTWPTCWLPVPPVRWDKFLVSQTTVGSARRNQLNHLLNATSGEARPPGPPADSLPHHTLPHTGEAGEQAHLRVWGIQASFSISVVVFVQILLSCIFAFLFPTVFHHQGGL